MANIYKILDELGIKYTKYEHQAVFTVQESDETINNIPGTHTKNLFLRNKKGDKYFLVIVKQETMVDLKKLKEFLNESKLSFTSPKKLKKYLNLTPGSVTPFGLINDNEHQVEVIIYDDLLDGQSINFHPDTNTATLNLSIDDFKKFLQNTKNTIKHFSLK